MRLDTTARDCGVDALHRTSFRWCIDRLSALLAHVDVIRLDHFRAFAAAWHIPAGETTAQVCEWMPGPGAEFFIGWVAGQAKNDFKVSRLRRLTCS